MSIDRIEIKSNIRSYSADFYDSEKFVDEALKITPSVFVVDGEVWKAHKKGVLKKLAGNDNLVVLPINEEKKSLKTVEQLFDILMERSAKRNLTLISIGGGIVQDVTGFLASTLYRGINWVFVPTTLLAQADSCIGAKTSLNYGKYKNLIGTFYPPSKIFIHAPFLRTQKDFDYYSGVGEVAKLHIIGGGKYVSTFMKGLAKIKKRDPKVLLEMVKSSLRIKKGYIEGDEFDSGRRNLLNYGHCFGHGIESATRFEIPHGQAVVMGMILANRAAYELGALSAEKEKNIRLSMLLPILSPELKKVRLDHAKIIDAMKRDKKRTGQGLALVMLKEDGSLERISTLTEENALKVLEEFKTLIKD